MVPWYRGFKGTIEISKENEGEYAFWQNGDNTMVDIKVKLKPEEKVAKKDLLQKFKLISIINTHTMHLFNTKGKIQKYDSPEAILEEFCKK
ncbi:DNA topoisomerase 2 [Orobanche gracilis]